MLLNSIVSRVRVQGFRSAAKGFVRSLKENVPLLSAISTDPFSKMIHALRLRRSPVFYWWKRALHISYPFHSSVQDGPLFPIATTRGNGSSLHNGLSYV